MTKGQSQISKVKSDSPIFKYRIQKNEKPPPEFGSGEYDDTEVGEESTSFVGAPDMGNNLVVKVHYALGGRKH